MLIYLQSIADPQDRNKFEQLYIQYKQLMFCVANSILRNEYDAEDAVERGGRSAGSDAGFPSKAGRYEPCVFQTV